MIKSYKLWRVKTPFNRRIGDNICYFESFHVCVIRLEDEAGNEAWGYAEKVADGYFEVEVSWQGKIPTLPEIEKEFAEEYWPLLQSAKTVEELQQSEKLKGDYYMKNALRYALWDLKGKQQGLPVYKLVNPGAEDRSVPCYSSGLEFRQDDDWVKDFYTQRKAEGYKMVKVKVGHHTYPDWDLMRLELVRETVGDDIEIAVDANLGWGDARTTLERINYFIKNGIELTYLEDPLKPTDLEGYRLLEKELPIKIAGHDYVPNPSDLRPLLDTGAIDYLRIRDGIEYGLEAQHLAKEYGIPMIVTNTFLEIGIHFAAGHPGVDRIEFADIGTNDFVEQPFEVKNGRMYAHNVPGTGLKPKQELLELWAV